MFSLTRDWPMKSAMRLGRTLASMRASSSNACPETTRCGDFCICGFATSPPNLRARQPSTLRPSSGQALRPASGQALRLAHGQLLLSNSAPAKPFDKSQGERDNCPYADLLALRAAPLGLVKRCSAARSTASKLALERSEERRVGKECRSR